MNSVDERRQRRLEYAKAYRESEMGRKKRREYNEKFKELKRIREREKYRNDPEWREKRKEATRKWKLARPYYREADKLKVYGLTPEKYQYLLSQQNGNCAICKNPPNIRLNGRIKSLAVDHDHKSNKVRGLLCDRCNRALGLFGDDLIILQDAIAYLKRQI